MKPLLLFSFFIFSLTLSAQTASRQLAFNLSAQQLAIKGYDPVAYFAAGKAVKGKSTLAVIHEGVLYYFSSAQNKTIFLAEPGKYEPQYGGWCAYAMGATGEKVEIDPETFKITDGKLFLFYNRYFTNTLKSWNRDEENLHTKADDNWTRILNRPS